MVLNNIKMHNLCLNYCLRGKQSMPGVIEVYNGVDWCIENIFKSNLLGLQDIPKKLKQDVLGPMGAFKELIETIEGIK